LHGGLYNQQRQGRRQAAFPMQLFGARISVRGVWGRLVGRGHLLLRLESSSASGNLRGTKSRTSEESALRTAGLQPGLVKPRGKPSLGGATASADAALIARIRSGEQDAMAELYDRYSPLVYSVALRALAETGAAEDVLQEVFMQLWRHPASFDASRGSLGPWLAVITRHRAIDVLRKRRPQTDIEDVVIAIEADLEGGAERGMAIEKVRASLHAMSDSQRKALEMAFFEGMTHSEIAAQTGEPLGTVKTRIRNGLQALRRALNA
jgi:RNA polymerase sigma-70 factor, ECF subfamily